MKFLAAGLAALALAALYLLAWPTGMAPVAWTAPAAPALEGRYEYNETLHGIQWLARGIGTGPAPLALDAIGQLYTGYDDGRIVVYTADGGTYTEIADTGGRPLGITFAPYGGLAVADAKRGLLHVGAKLTPLGSTLKFAHDADNTRLDKNIYFTDASAKFGRRRAMTDLLEHGGNGRLLAYNFDTKQTRVLLDGLHFPDGVAVGPDDDYVLVAETGEYRVLRYWLRGDRAGQHDVFIDNLPGFPAKLSYNDHGTFWLALAAPRSPQLDELLSGHFFARQLLGRLPGSWLRRGDPHAYVLGLNLRGEVVANAQYAGASAFAPITSVRERGPWLFFGSDQVAAVGRLALRDVVPGASPPPFSDRIPVPTQVKKHYSREDEEEAREEAARRGKKE